MEFGDYAAELVKDWPELGADQAMMLRRVFADDDGLLRALVESEIELKAVPED